MRPEEAQIVVSMAQKYLSIRVSIIFSLFFSFLAAVSFFFFLCACFQTSELTLCKNEIITVSQPFALLSSLLLMFDSFFFFDCEGSVIGGWVRTLKAKLDLFPAITFDASVRILFVFLFWVAHFFLLCLLVSSARFIAFLLSFRLFCVLLFFSF